MKLPKPWILAKKELFTLVNSPLFYGICLFFTLFCSIWLYYLQRYFTMNMASLRPYFAAFPVAFILVIPMITMKSWAEERKLGSIELLLTMPFSEWDLVLGKFTAALTVVLLLLGLTLPVPLSILPLGRFDLGVLAGEYAGVLLLGSAASALGLLLSSLSKNQAGAFLGSTAVLLISMLINQLALTVSLPPFLAAGVNFLSLSFHFDSFSKGIIDTRDLAFFVITTVMFLFFNTRVILFRKWS
ncbi:MAG: ABC transporter permease subunit [Spirochaetaceae bacterium]|jgi:ABC-2 type transport system permease protein|nr:ABC transporter permease subunit [Spirochaetaceae bacterium]